jgi:hypothetical protein
MMKTDKKEKLLKAKIAVALQDEYKRVPTEDEINSAVLGLHYRRQEQKKSGQLTIF